MLIFAALQVKSMEYNFSEIEKKWQAFWQKNKSYEVSNNSSKPSFYVLDMFPYPSGAGLHVGHPLGYIASDIYSRFKRLQGFNVLHPMGFDSFGLPAEQYALETGQHPAVTTAKNIETFIAQLQKIGFCYDWSRAVQTSDPNYYKFTQQLFLELYNSYFCEKENKAMPIVNLIKSFEADGGKVFSAAEWKAFTELQQQDILMQHRLAFSSFGEVNWCEALGTVLANDEVINGLSERGSHPVEKKKMRQWYLRITAYADRLLQGLETVNFSEPMKEMQRNWIGKSEGAEINFDSNGHSIKVYTTRPDTIFGVDFLVLAPEHELVAQLTTTEQSAKVNEYLTYVKSRSDRERMSEVKQVTGCFIGAYATNPISQKQIPIYIAEYVLAGYGTGAIMAVPCGDQRDFAFATHFEIPVTNIIGDAFSWNEANPTKDAKLSNSDFLNGMLMKDAIAVAINKIVALGVGNKKINYKMRDAGFSRQRYWGEPFPIIWDNGVPKALDKKDLPLALPHVEKYGPGPNGEGPLANITDWVNTPEGRRETSTMPGYAGSSWYFLRYMDPHNAQEFCSKQASDYWNQVDVYIGGTEHAVGHLLYSRMWTKVLYDLGYISFDEPFKKLVNQGMITGRSYFFAVNKQGQIVSYDKANQENTQLRFKYGHQFVDGNNQITKDVLEAAIAKYNLEIKNEIVWDNGLLTLQEVSEKMSKSKFNVDNPDDVVDKYGADTFRMFEMFLGPVEQSKPWDTKSIEGVHRFLKKLWRLFFDEQKGKVFITEAATEAELKIVHKAIKKISGDTETFSFNTAVSAFMVCVNELADAKCYKKEVLELLLILLSPYAPHISEELWAQLGNTTSILDATMPIANEALLAESSKDYPVSINGKMRTNITLATDVSEADAQAATLANEVIQKWLDGATPKKIIFVKGRMINVVV
jgi:leucyl-tRNA synthetase